MEIPTTAQLEVTVAEAAELLKSDQPPALVDVREPEEWELVHLEGSRLITQELIEEMMSDWKRDTPILCYCHHGIRSLQATHFFRNQGFTNVRSVRGGIEAWAVEIDPSLPRY